MFAGANCYRKHRHYITCITDADSLLNHRKMLFTDWIFWFVLYNPLNTLRYLLYKFWCVTSCIYPNPPFGRYPPDNVVDWLE